MSAYHSSLNTRYVYISRAHKSWALNRVLDLVEDCLIVFTDDDVRVHPGTLCAYAKVSANVNGGQFYGGPMGVDYEQEPSEWLKAYLPRSALGWCLDKEVRTIDKSERFLGINWAAFASDLKKCGGFNPAFGPGSPTGSTGQETNMQKRLVGGGAGNIYT